MKLMIASDIHGAAPFSPDPAFPGRPAAPRRSVLLPPGRGRFHATEQQAFAEKCLRPMTGSRRRSSFCWGIFSITDPAMSCRRTMLYDCGGYAARYRKASSVSACVRQLFGLGDSFKVHALCLEHAHNLLEGKPSVSLALPM